MVTSSRLGLVGAAVPEDLPHLFGRGVELDLVVVFLHAAERTTDFRRAATVAPREHEVADHRRRRARDGAVRPLGRAAPRGVPGSGLEAGDHRRRRAGQLPRQRHRVRMDRRLAVHAGRALGERPPRSRPRHRGRPGRERSGASRRVDGRAGRRGERAVPHDDARPRRHPRRRLPWPPTPARTTRGSPTSAGTIRSACASRRCCRSPTSAGRWRRSSGPSTTGPPP